MMLFFNEIQTLLRNIKYIKYLKRNLIPQETKAVTLSLYKILFGCVVCGLCHGRIVEEADSPSAWSYPVLLEPFKKYQSIDIVCGSHETWNPENSVRISRTYCNCFDNAFSSV